MALFYTGKRIVFVFDFVFSGGGGAGYIIHVFFKGVEGYMQSCMIMQFANNC